MSERPTAVNGKRNQAWGTTTACPECGECLCFGCHPRGPCVDERQDEVAFAGQAVGRGSWPFAPEGSLGASVSTKPQALSPSP